MYTPMGTEPRPNRSSRSFCIPTPPPDRPGPAGNHLRVTRHLGRHPRTDVRYTRQWAGLSDGRRASRAPSADAGEALVVGGGGSGPARDPVRRAAADGGLRDAHTGACEHDEASVSSRQEAPGGGLGTSSSPQGGRAPSDEPRRCPPPPPGRRWRRAPRPPTQRPLSAPPTA